jgi:hypothetical protein
MERERPARVIPTVVLLVVAVCLSAFVAWPGDRREGIPSRLRWDFADATTPAWHSPNATVTRSTEGLTLDPAGDPAQIRSTPIDVQAVRHDRLRVRLKTERAAAGTVRVVFITLTGRRYLERGFRTQGANFEEVVVTLGDDLPPDVVGQEIMLTPSNEVQRVVIASIALEPSATTLVARIEEAVSPWPGEAASWEPASINMLRPPTVDGYSIWRALVPLVLVLGAAAVELDGMGARRRPTRLAWAAVCAVWGAGFALAVYHQAVALSLDMARSGRASAYTAIDYVPLRDDMQTVARYVPAGASVEVSIREDRPNVVTTWTARIPYYLYPIRVRDQSPFTVVYFGQPHLPCEQVEPGRPLLHEAMRFCLFGGKA